MSYNIDEVIDEVFRLLARGKEKYENSKTRSVTQLEHALQSGQLALESGETDETVIAALLHDVGHYLPHVQAVELVTSGPSMSRRSHDGVGELYLTKLGFPESVTSLVGAHIDAKRYLTATDSTYYDQLSVSSKNSLRLQGGPFTAEEAEAFAKLPRVREKVLLRVFDDKAKVVDHENMKLESFRPIMERVLTAAH